MQGEQVTAYVVAAEGLTAQALIDHVGRQLSAGQRPRRVLFVDELPRSAPPARGGGSLSPPPSRAAGPAPASGRAPRRSAPRSDPVRRSATPRWSR
ncbi:hypothetical protein [Micromonospora sp. ATCC 39149]|uniref:AMP-binding enzyme n=1 Tax=Micromonospora sp. (strain ATCC 39149 / NRRL 15099 / SCC 1413) TaxID=219305 RepID=UPI001E575386|nr:hypothetical protein [Micromonospora sp. ATCC 39149]